jgi:hypothetical protein
LTEAIFGLVGVLIGGILTGGIDYFMRRREPPRTWASISLRRTPTPPVWQANVAALDFGHSRSPLIDATRPAL